MGATCARGVSVDVVTLNKDTLERLTAISHATVRARFALWPLLSVSVSAHLFFCKGSVVWTVSTVVWLTVRFAAFVVSFEALKSGPERWCARVCCIVRCSLYVNARACVWCDVVRCRRACAGVVAPRDDRRFDAVSKSENTHARPHTHGTNHARTHTHTHSNSVYFSV